MKDKFIKEFLIKLILYLSVILFVICSSYFTSVEMQKMYASEISENHKVYQNSKLEIEKNSLFVYFTVNESLVEYYDIVKHEFYFNFYLRKKSESIKLKMNKCRFFSEEYKNTVDGFCLSEKINLLNSISKNHSNLHFEMEVCDDESKSCMKKFEISKYKVHINALLLINEKLHLKPLFKSNLTIKEKLIAEISLSKNTNISQKNSNNNNSDISLDTIKYKDLKKQIIGIDSEKYLSKFNEKQISNDVWYNLNENDNSGISKEYKLPVNISLNDETIYKLMLIKDLEFVKLKQQEIYISKFNNIKYDPFEFYITQEYFVNYSSQKQQSSLSKIELKFVNSGNYEETILTIKYSNFYIFFALIFLVQAIVILISFNYIEKVNFYLNFINSNFKYNEKGNNIEKQPELSKIQKIKKELKLDKEFWDFDSADENIDNSNHKENNENSSNENKKKIFEKSVEEMSFDSLNCIDYKFKSNSNPILISSRNSRIQINNNEIKKSVSSIEPFSKLKFQNEEPYYSYSYMKFLENKESNNFEKNDKDKGIQGMIKDIDDFNEIISEAKINQNSKNSILEIEEKDSSENSDNNDENPTIFSKIEKYLFNKNNVINEKISEKEKEVYDIKNQDLNTSLTIEKSLINNKKRNTHKISHISSNKIIKHYGKNCNPIFLNTNLEVDKTKEKKVEVTKNVSDDTDENENKTNLSFIDFIFLSIFNFFNIFNISFSFCKKLEKKRLLLDKSFDFINKFNKNYLLENINQKRDIGFLRYLTLNLEQNNLFNYVKKQKKFTDIEINEENGISIWPEKLIYNDVDDLLIKNLKFKFITKYRDIDLNIHKEKEKDLNRKSNTKSLLFTNSNSSTDFTINEQPFDFTNMINYKLSKIISSNSI